MRIELPELEPACLDEAMRQLTRRTAALYQLRASGAMTSRRCLDELVDLWSSFRGTVIDLGISEWTIDDEPH